jgi:hypothetical protein
MYLFNRAMRVAPGNLLDSMAWAAKITEKVNAVGGPEVRLWSRVLGPDAGTLSWSAVVTEIAELMTLDEKLMADGSYLELVEQGARFVHDSGMQDSLGRLVHADPDGLDTAQYASITTTRLAPGMMATGVALGVELAQQVKAITGRPTSFGTSVTGPFGAVAFFALSETIEQVQAANEALAADAGWLAALDARASKAYIAESSEQMILRRLA